MRSWLPLLELLALAERPRTVLWLTGAESEAWRTDLEALCRRSGSRLVSVDPAGEAAVPPEVDLVLLEGDLNWRATIARLRWLAGPADRAAEAKLPVVLVSHVGWPYGRRDRYDGPPPGPPDHPHAHRRGGLLPAAAEPVGGKGFAADGRHALREHPFRNGRLTAVEDFVREQPPHLRLRVLPGFHGLAVLAPEERLRRSSALRRLFDDPGRLLLDLGHVEELEKARLAVLSTGPRAAAGTPAPPAAATQAEPAAVPPAAPAPAPPAPAPPPTARPPAVRTGPPPGAEAERTLASQQAELRRLASTLLEVRGNVLDLLESRRWRMGDRIGDLFLKLTRRPRTETAADRLSQILTGVDSRQLTDLLARGRTPRLAPAAAAPAAPPAAATAPARPAGGFAGALAALDPGAFAAELEAALRRTAEWVERSRVRPLRRPPLVSVVMPTRDRPQVIGDALRSAVEQTYERWELIVCGDGDTPGTREAVLAVGDPRIRYLPIEAAGAAAARNRALETARGELIAYLDDDNLWHPDLLRTLVAVLDERPAFAGAFAGYLAVEVRGDRSLLHGVETPRWDYEALRRANFVDLNALVHRRELYDVLGGFDESLSRHQDWDLVLRYGFAGDLLAIDAPFALYRRNRRWRQISSRPGEESWQRVRLAAERMFVDGGPRTVRLPPALPLTVVFDGRDAAAWARAEGLQRALGRRRTVRLAAVGSIVGGAAAATEGLRSPLLLLLGDDRDADAGALAEACGDGLLYVLAAAGDPALALARAAGDRLGAGSLLLVEWSGEVPAAEAAAPAAPADRAAGRREVHLVQALTPGPVPAGFGLIAPVCRQPVRAGEPAAEPARTVVSMGGDRQRDDHAAIESALAAAGLPVVAVELGDPPRERSADLGRLVERGGALLVLAGAPDEPLGAEARRAVAEAFARRVPVVALAAAELADLAGEDCLTLLGGAPAEIVDSVRALLADDALRSRRTAKAWRLACRRYAPEAVARSLELIVAGATAVAAGEAPPAPAAEAAVEPPALTRGGARR